MWVSHGIKRKLKVLSHAKDLDLRKVDTETRDNTLHHAATYCNTLQIHCEPTATIAGVKTRALHCSTLQHTATHCSTLKDAATHCNTLQHILQRTATHCNTLQHIATHCNTLQHIATHCNRLRHTADPLRACCHHCWHQNSSITLQHTATHCSTLQHTAAHCNTLNDTTTQCNTL